MKKVLKILLSILFIAGSIFVTLKLIANYSDDGLAFIVLAFTFFFTHLFAWIAPKIFFNLCWKITSILPDNFDYDTGYKKLEIVGLGILIVANGLLVIGYLMI